MPATKTDAFSESTLRLANLAKALGHPARIAILKILVQKKACICGAIVEELPLSQATVSQHLKVLKEVGLIQGNIDGPRICYCIHPPTWQELQTALGGFLADSIPGPSCC